MKYSGLDRVYVGLDIVIIAEVDVASKRFSTTQRPFGVKWVATNLETGCTHIFCTQLHTTAHRHLPHILRTQYNVRHISCTQLHTTQCTHTFCILLHIVIFRTSSAHNTEFLFIMYCNWFLSPQKEILDILKPSSYKDTLEDLLSISNHTIALFSFLNKAEPWGQNIKKL